MNCLVCCQKMPVRGMDYLRIQIPMACDKTGALYRDGHERVNKQAVLIDVPKFVKVILCYISVPFRCKVALGLL